MFVQTATFTESPLAYLALIRLLTRMCAHVGGQADFLRKVFVAHFASKWLFASVGAHVCGQVATYTEALATYLARVRFFACVCPLVFVQVTS